MLEGKSVSFKTELLLRNSIDFDTLPAWQKYGIGVYWADFEKVGINPITGAEERAIRRRLYVDYDFCVGVDYGDRVVEFLESV